MILKGNERGNGHELANHLMKGRENEHIELHELRGFVADDLHGAMKETEAISKGTKCQNYLFSLSLNPPENERVDTQIFDDAVNRIEGELGLEGQPRAVVFHEKEGRRHAHAVWSRINGEEMKAINMPHYKTRLNEIARDLYREHGWEMPEGFKDRRNRDPLNFSLEEYQQAKRAKQDAKAIRRILQESWAGSDNRKSFEAALHDNGFVLARGGARGFVAMDWKGNVHSLSRATEVKTKELQERLGPPKALISLERAKKVVSDRMTPQLKTWAKEAENKVWEQGLAAKFQREQMVQRQRQLREQLQRQHEERWLVEEKKRAERTPKGIRGLWGWITGKNRKIREENEAEMERARQRDKAEKDAMIQRQLSERRKVQRQIVQVREKQNAELRDLNRDVAKYMMMGGKASIDVTHGKIEREKERLRERDHAKRLDRRTNHNRGHEPE